ncbi:hypothetical protein F5Y03DRAFT_63570 [Xylaria venustula]|nr:hypothetical protein F5Y03DRAFT_63570 [Xylaria venustula]
MARDPLVWVLVRDYILLKTNSLVQSPSVDLRAHNPPIIIRGINGDYLEEPRIVDDIALLGDDFNRKDYRHAAHGVCFSREFHAFDFPVWVCLERNVNIQEYHLWVLNLYSFKFLEVPISTICWIPSHVAANGELYTVIGSPGKHGYKETRLPTIRQTPGLPEQAKFAVPFSNLPGLTKLEPERQQDLFYQQYMSTKQGHKTHQNPDLSKRRHPHKIISSELPGFCRGDDYISGDEEIVGGLDQASVGEIWQRIPEEFPHCTGSYLKLGPASLTLNLLHWHVKNSQCDLGSAHQSHCILAHRPVRCVISGPNHEHCVFSAGTIVVANSMATNVEHLAAGSNTAADHNAAAETESNLDDEEVDSQFLLNELERFTGQHCFRDSDKAHEDRDLQIWSTQHTPESLESRQVSPVIDWFPKTPENQEILDILPDPCLHFTSAIQGTVVDYDAFITTPEPPEIFR